MGELDSLFVSGKELDESLLVKILTPFLKIDQDSGSIVPNERWLRVSNEFRIILYLVSRKARVVRNLAIDNEGATPLEIENATGVKGGSLRPRLKSLLTQKIVDKEDNSRYFVPNYSLIRVKNMIDTYMKEHSNEQRDD